MTTTDFMLADVFDAINGLAYGMGCFKQQPEPYPRPITIEAQEHKRDRKISAKSALAGFMGGIT